MGDLLCCCVGVGVLVLLGAGAGGGGWLVVVWSRHRMIPGDMTARYRRAPDDLGRTLSGLAQVTTVLVHGSGASAPCTAIYPLHLGIAIELLNDGDDQ